MDNAIFSQFIVGAHVKHLFGNHIKQFVAEMVSMSKPYHLSRHLSTTQSPDYSRISLQWI